MKKQCLALMVLLIALLGCQAQPEPAMTLVFDGDICSYKGPTTLPAGPVKVNWKIEGPPREGYAVALLTLDGGKAFEDLDAWPSTDQPPWSYLHVFRERNPDDLSPFVTRVS